MENLKKIKVIIEDLINHYKKDAKLSIIEILSQLLSQIFTLTLLITIISVVIIFLSIAFSIMINHLLESNYIGYIIVAFFYLCTFIIIKLKIRFSTEPLFINSFIKIFVKLLYYEKED